MSSVLGVRLVGPLSSYGAGFAAELAGLGYTSQSLALQLRLMAHLSRWMADRGVEPDGLTLDVVESFLAARRDAGHRFHRTLAALEPLLTFLASLGVVEQNGGDTQNPHFSGPAAVLLGRYRSFLENDRQLVPRSVHNYIVAVRPFVEGLVVDGEWDPDQVTAAAVSTFLLGVASEQKPTKTKTTATALRSLLRFLHVDGQVSFSLVGVVPSVASRRLAPFPQALEPEEVARLLAACDRETGAGLRDYAIILLLVRLGLRAGDVAGLGLDDIDWRSGELTVAGKNRRPERLPLPYDVGEAIVAYLRGGRPSTAQGRTVFVRLLAPHRRLTSEAVSMVVATAAKRAGLEGRVGAHRLRHTAATQTLAQGGSLTEVGQLLRHRKALTTRIYAKTDRRALAGLARRWPGATE